MATTWRRTTATRRRSASQSPLPLQVTHPSKHCSSRTEAARALSLIPTEDPQCAQRVPPAGSTIAVLEREVDRAGMGVLQKPRAVRLLLGSEHINRFAHARVRRIPSRPEVLQRTQPVVVPAGRKRELQPGGVDDGAGALTPEQLPVEEVLLTPAASRDGFRRTAGGALVAQQPFQDSDRGMEGRTNRTVLHFAVP